MPRVRVWTNPDGSVAVFYPNEKLRLSGESDADFVIRRAAIDGPKQGRGATPFIDLDPATLPTDRVNRHKWRVQGKNVVVDNTVPNLEHPRQNLINKVRGSNSVPALRAQVEALIRGEN